MQKLLRTYSASMIPPFSLVPTGQKTLITKRTVSSEIFKSHRPSQEGSKSPVLESILAIMELTGQSNPSFGLKGKFLESPSSAILDKTLKKHHPAN